MMEMPFVAIYWLKKVAVLLDLSVLLYSIRAISIFASVCDHDRKRLSAHDKDSDLKVMSRGSAGVQTPKGRSRRGQLRRGGRRTGWRRTSCRHRGWQPRAL